MMAAHSEYRWRFYKRWGAVVFAGIGSILGDEDGKEAFERRTLPSAGLGLRYMTSREKNNNLRLDYAQSVGGYDGVYFGEMEAF